MFRVKLGRQTESEINEASETSELSETSEPSGPSQTSEACENCSLNFFYLKTQSHVQGIFSEADRE